MLDIAGNVREWTCTPFATRGAGSVGSCAPHFDEATNLVLRGGSWQEPQQALELVHRSPFGAWHRNVWTGFRLVPHAFEFWMDRPFRLHERRRFELGNDGQWTSGLLYP